VQKKIGGQKVNTVIMQGSSRVGGGAFPEQDLPTYMLGLRPKDMGISELKDGLLHCDPPLVGRVEEDWFCLDVRTLQEEEFSLVVQSLRQAMSDLDQ
jgi:L-seryl-tRNA(Ser) seleniumtransferase